MSALYLIPTGLGAAAPVAALPVATLEVVRRLNRFIAEDAKSARAFLKAAGHPAPLQALSIETLDEHTPQSRIAELIEPLAAGADCGIMSEAGCPGVADPGAALVHAAHEAGIRVVPLAGPSALLLALMGSGMNGQCFAFHGYLPVERGARARRLTELERESETRQMTQIFIEAPYRNDALLAALLETCSEDTEVCVATDLTLPTEAIATRAVREWRRAPPQLNRRPTVFLLYRRAVRLDQKR